MVTEDQVITTLEQCMDPEIPVDIWNLGLIYDIQIKESKTGTNTQTKVESYGQLQISPKSMQVWWKRIPVELTPTEFEILYALVKSSNPVPYDDLNKVTRQGVVENNTINTHILHLRKKFRKVDPDFDCIKAKYGLGYQWIEQ